MEDYWMKKASEYFKLPISQVTKVQRAITKEIYWGEVYSALGTCSFQEIEKK